MKLLNYVTIPLLLVGGLTVSAERNLFSGNLSVPILVDILVDREAFQPFPPYADREAWEGVHVAVREPVIQSAEESLGEEWRSVSIQTLFHFFETGSREQWEGIAFGKRHRLWQLVVAELLEGEGRFIDEIINGIWSICEESTWVIPAHMNQWYDEGAVPDVRDAYVDTVAAETASLLAWTVYFFEDELDSVSPEIVNRIRYEVNWRVIEPTLEKNFWWMGFDEDRRRPNNWNPWIVSNVIPASMILDESRERRAETIYRLTRIVDQFANPYPSDGGVDEGAGYWGIAVGSLFDNIEILSAATDGHFDLFSEDLVRNMGEFIYKVNFGNGYVVNFADSRPRVNPHIGGIVYRYGRAIGSEKMKQYGAYLWQEWDYVPVIHAWRLWRSLADALVYPAVIEYPAAEPLELDVWFPEIEVMVSRSVAGSTNGLKVAAKGGHNDESHNHNDIGNFILYIDGEPALIDVGHGTYTRRTFGQERYTVWFNRSEYHNVPTINGFEQKPGPRFAARNADFEYTEDYAKLSLDIAGAYPEEAGVREWTRIIRLNRSESLELSDRFTLEKREQLAFNFMTVHRIEELYPGLLRLRHSERPNVLVEYDPRQLYWDWERIPLDQPEDIAVINHWGENMYRLQFRMDQPRAKNEVKIFFRKE
ncbi:MAG: heparinase II/III family protein [Opitutales bacterium]|nr:heparinase II/III family protein [Opitutales bacterium]